MNCEEKLEDEIYHLAVSLGFTELVDVELLRKDCKGIVDEYLLEKKESNNNHSPFCNEHTFRGMTVCEILSKYGTYLGRLILKDMIEKE